jgi:hypothetical protein
MSEKSPQLGRIAIRVIQKFVHAPTPPNSAIGFFMSHSPADVCASTNGFKDESDQELQSLLQGAPKTAPGRERGVAARREMPAWPRQAAL